ncbi:hypothetical protein ALC62_05298 [Cyphomyrmex costatus]|uniref:Uncharacterized protein n=1 Tax=Cyphomyrmex costatus TaxID=456900 RepID=A0A195CSW5_9HYME|nr:hypothetical protein ALC62_05298 [Cyphomyrmex costatus]
MIIRDFTAIRRADGQQKLMLAEKVAGVWGAINAPFCIIRRCGYDGERPLVNGGEKPRDAKRARRIKFSRCLSSRAEPT